MSQHPDYDKPVPSDTPVPSDPDRLPPDGEPLSPDIPDSDNPDRPVKQL